MTGPPDVGPSQADPGGLQARADGQQVEVRTYEGDLVRIVSVAVAQYLTDSGLADDLRHCLRTSFGNSLR